MKINTEKLLNVWDAMMIFIMIAAVLIRLGTIQNPYTPEDMQMFSLTAVAVSGSYVMHRVA